MINQSIEILIPAYNEEKNIEEVVQKSLSWLKSQTKNYLVTVVDDGSSDNTGKILDLLAKKNKHANIIHHRKNLGIGKAWRTLYNASSKDIVFTCPADQQFDPLDFSKAMPYLSADIISIYRPKKYDYSLFRILLTNAHRLIIRIFFGLNIKDINWVKMYKKRFLKELDLKLQSGLIETEILVKAKKRNARIVQVEAPYYFRPYGKSRGAGLRNISQTISELIRLCQIIIKFK
ncbi:MAG: glycosyltransferase family 2 protein [Candidatus Nanoarchaeia archaeon]|nr:glycosyltransferase family 2 protein [Candidatus Nanoarchaeia archaeon]MDD5741423.1 glycosyltransferase family 2 protein [Candidatus Nanoarchaeia archaeon]